jgi:histone H3/H4
MKTAHRQASRHKRQMLALQNNPVARAVHRATAYRIKSTACEEFEDQVRTTRIKLLMATAGEDATELLACLAVVIGTPCEAGAQELGRNVPWVRQLHGALRTIQRMCLDGYHWQSAAALSLDRAIEVAVEQQDALDDVGFATAWVEANGFAGAILRHEVRADSVRGGA